MACMNDLKILNPKPVTTQERAAALAARDKTRAEILRRLAARRLDVSIEQLLQRLVDPDDELTATQVKALEVALGVNLKLLNKLVPDTRAVEVGGGDSGPLEVVVRTAFDE